MAQLVIDAIKETFPRSTSYYGGVFGVAVLAALALLLWGAMPALLAWGTYAVVPAGRDPAI